MNVHFIVIESEVYDSNLKLYSIQGVTENIRFSKGNIYN